MNQEIFMYTKRTVDDQSYSYSTLTKVYSSQSVVACLQILQKTLSMFNANITHYSQTIMWLNPERLIHLGLIGAVKMYWPISKT